MLLKCGIKMYGKETLNNHQIIKYGLTKEFFQAFHLLKYLDIELPLIMHRKYSIYIQPFINKQLYNLEYIKNSQKKHQLKSIADVQKELARNPRSIIDLENKNKRTAILLDCSLVKFALDKLKNRQVVLIAKNKKEAVGLQKIKLPKNFKVVNLKGIISKQAVPSEKLVNLFKILSKIIRLHSGHEIFGKKFFNNWLIKNLIYSVNLLSAFDFIIRTYGVKAIMDINEYTEKGTALALLAKKYNLPYINIPQDLIADLSLIPSRASYYFVWGENYKKWLVKRGIDPKSIKITGNLRFEYQDTKPHITREKLLYDLKIPPDHQIFLFTTQSLPEKVNKIVMNWIIYTANSVKNLPVTFVIKPHPGDKSNYQMYLENKRVRLLSKQYPLYDILNNCDFVLTISSTTAIEAALLNKRIIVLQPSIPYMQARNTNAFHSHLVQAAAGPAIYNRKQLKECVEKILKDEKYRINTYYQGQKFLSNTLPVKDGRTPSKMVLNAMDEVINKKK